MHAYCSAYLRIFIGAFSKYTSVLVKAGENGDTSIDFHHFSNKMQPGTRPDMVLASAYKAFPAVKQYSMLSFMTPIVIEDKKEVSGSFVARI